MKNKWMLSVLLLSVSASYAQNGKEQFVGEEKVKQPDGSIKVIKHYKTEGSGSYIPGKSFKQLSGPALKAFQDACAKAKGNGFVLNGIKYDKNCKPIDEKGKEVPGVVTTREEVVVIPPVTQPVSTLPPEPKVGFDGRSSEFHEVRMNNRVIKVDKSDFDLWNSTKDKKKKDLFLDFAKKYKK